MNKMTIESNDCLSRETLAYYHTDFYGSKNFDRNPNYLYKFKNDPQHNWTEQQIDQAIIQLRNVLLEDLPTILQEQQVNSLTVCVIARAKADRTYRANQLLFKATIKSVVNQLNGFLDGTDYIIRHTNTRTTHLRRPMDGFVNDGPLPYKGITKDTCSISDDVNGKDILLIDDIYTHGVDIDEDAIQALLDKGAKSVIFYAIGKTV